MSNEAPTSEALDLYDELCERQRRQRRQPRMVMRLPKTSPPPRDSVLSAESSPVQSGAGASRFYWHRLPCSERATVYDREEVGDVMECRVERVEFVVAALNAADLREKACDL